MVREIDRTEEIEALLKRADELDYHPLIEDMSETLKSILADIATAKALATRATTGAGDQPHCAEYDAYKAAAKAIFAAENELCGRSTSLIALRKIIYNQANALRAAGLEIEGGVG